MDVARHVLRSEGGVRGLFRLKIQVVALALRIYLIYLQSLLKLNLEQSKDTTVVFMMSWPCHLQEVYCFDEREHLGFRV
ncbi:hypothetical protein GUJ93_ZPchr0007g3513 [Zizania palustris]|uniref:Uncharacterized protein n=1 Tax=Zizania palustris TaxID=103762 RepID=A0A8J5T3Q7_ZIZPA|nr:hypothetical protein GUJ93_ZPchr0007g3513 [Zizania palustris]